MHPSEKILPKSIPQDLQKNLTPAQAEVYWIQRHRQQTEIRKAVEETKTSGFDPFRWSGAK